MLKTKMLNATETVEWLDKIERESRQRGHVLINTGAEPLAWRTSRRSQTNAACVEVAVAGDLVVVRDSKNQTSPMITFERAQFATFLDETSN